MNLFTVRSPRSGKNISAPRVVVTYGRSLMSLVIAHSLGKRGVEVYGCDDVDLTVLSFSRYVVKNFVHAALDADPERFLTDLEQKLRRFRPQDGRPYILMPVFRETEIISKHRDRFESFIQIAAPPYEAIEKVHPKDNLFRTANELGIRIPDTRCPAFDYGRTDKTNRIQNRLPDGLPDTVLSGLSYPVLLKPPDDVGGRGIEKCSSPAELRAAYNRYYERGRQKPPLIQTYLPGEDYCLTVLFEHGRLVAGMAYKNIRRFPAETGAGIVRETVDDTPFLETAGALLGAIGWHGIAELDFRWNGIPDSRPFLIEVNPRFWAGLFQSVESGLDFPWLLFQMTLTGHSPEPERIEIGRRTKIPGLWLLSAVRDVSVSDVRFEKLGKTWSEIRKRIRNKQIRDAFVILTGSLDNGIPVRETFSSLRSIVQEGRSAKNDLFYRDDPFIVLGVLFILASVLRHGVLPPEIRNR
jgi:predicted ATP-grasp superfamily ATP-dependent carboligase